MKERNEPYTGTSWYTCRVCDGEFTYASGLIEKSMCSNCIRDDIIKYNKEQEKRRIAIMDYERWLYGNDVYIAYWLLLEASMSENDKTHIYETLTSKEAN